MPKASASLCLRSVIGLGIFALTTFAHAQAWQDPANWKTVSAPTASQNIVYRHASDIDLHLDVYQNANPGSAPVLVYFHGGGWTNGEKPANWGGFRSWISAGFSVVTVDYRLRATATAPAAVEDARCAAAWVKSNAAKYHFDLTRVVYYGTSAGGHLAMMDAMLPPGNDIDPPDCHDVPKAAAVLDFYGVYILDPAIPGAYIGSTKNWIGNAPDVTAMEHRMSPQSYIRKGLPPVFIAHGDADPTVPYIASLTLKKDLDAVAVPNKMVTVPGGLHGKWTPEENQRVQLESLNFLHQQGIIP